MNYANYNPTEERILASMGQTIPDLTYQAIPREDIIAMMYNSTPKPTRLDDNYGPVHCVVSLSSYSAVSDILTACIFNPFGTYVGEGNKKFFGVVSKYEVKEGLESLSAFLENITADKEVTHYVWVQNMLDTMNEIEGYEVFVLDEFFEKTMDCDTLFTLANVSLGDVAHKTNRAQHLASCIQLALRRLDLRGVNGSL